MNDTPPPTVDLLIAGLGPGGCAAALAARQAGLRTVAVEARAVEATRAQLVLVRPGAQAALRSIGLPDVTEGRRTSSIRHVENRMRAAVLEATVDPWLGVQWQTSVCGLRLLDGQVCVTLRDNRDGKQRQIMAKRLIDATGGRLEDFGRPARHRRGPRHWVIAAEYGTPPWFEGIVGVRDPKTHEMYLLFPTWGRHGVICYHDAPPGDAVSAEALQQRFALAAQRLGLGAPLQKVVAIDVQQRLLPQACNDLVLPIGDAVGTVDVLLGAGMSIAIEDGVDAARAVANALQQRQPAALTTVSRHLYRRHRAAHWRGRCLLGVRPLIERAWPSADLLTLGREQLAPPPLLWPAVRLLFGRRPAPLSERR